MAVCKYLEIEPDKAGRYIQRKDAAHRCLAPDPVLPLMPACVEITLRRGWTVKDKCAVCPVREDR